MSTETHDETEFFNQDFTTATRWEVFCARLEEIIHDWKLSFKNRSDDKLAPNALAFNEWETKEELVTYDGIDLRITLYSVKMSIDEDDKSDDDMTDSMASVSIESEKNASQKQNQLGISDCQAFIDLMSLENNWCTLDEKSNATIHPLARWYGLRKFVVVSTVGTTVLTENQRRMLLSSVHVAIGETTCEIPIFVQALRHQQHVYSGVCEFENTRLSFDIVHLGQTHPTCKYLSGLLDTFKEKINYDYMDPVTVSVRFTYNLKEFSSVTFIPKRKFAFAADRSDDDNEIKSKSILPFGVSLDPVLELVLYCTWPEVAENVVMDSRNYTDFDPMLAPAWSFRFHYEAIPNSFMAECIFEFLQHRESTKTLADLIGSEYLYAGGSDLVGRDDGGNPLERLTVSKISKLTTSVLSAAMSNSNASTVSAATPKKAPQKKPAKALEGPLKDEQLMGMLYYLFPDAQENTTNPYKIPITDIFDPMRIKSAFKDSLVHRFGTLLALCVTYLGGHRAVAQLWAEFVQEMRYRVERSILIPGVAEGFPDPRTCLLHQKLQMLNICMDRRRIREGNLSFAMANSNKSNLNSRSDDDSDADEFFDCDTTNIDDDDAEQSKYHYAPWNKPEGRLSKLNYMKLIDSDEFLYVPVTQEPVPKTEDQLEDDAEVMLKLGPESELRTQILSASLLSDMESFKAANPNGKLEDFIRWYSPRDWIEDEESRDAVVSGSGDANQPKKGRLSSRMLIPGNTWQTVWTAAKPVPARRQRRLFDDTREAEKVLHFLESKNIGQIVQLTIAPLFHSAVLRVKEESHTFSSIIPNYEQIVDKLMSMCCRLSRESWSMNTLSAKGSSNQKWHNMLNDITNMEYMVVKCQSIIRKLYPDVEQFDKTQTNVLKSLLSGHEVSLSEGAFGPLSEQILRMFTEAKVIQSEQSTASGQKDTPITLPDPSEKEFTLRICGKTTHAIGNGGPQFLRAILKTDEFRLCGAFSHDMKFF